MNSRFKCVVASCALVLVGAGCGGPLRYTMRGSPSAAGADASLEANVDTAQSMTRLNAHASDLAPPDRIRAGATVFVVWQRRNPGQPWVRLGTLDYNAASRVGDLRDVNVPETSFELQITAEADAQPGSPSDSVAFDQMVGTPAR